MSAALIVLGASVLFELAPTVAAVAAERTLSRPLRLVAACFAVMFLQDAIGWWMADRGINNLWLSHVGTPLQTLLLLLALAHWQMGETERRAVRIVAPVFLVLWGILLVAVEAPRTFSRFTQPLQAILIVAIAAWTMIRRTTRTFEAPAAEPWFWVTSGLLLYFGTGAVLSPVSNLLVRTAPDLVMAAHVGKAVVNIVAYLLVARGMLCRLTSGSSGGSSWPPASSPSSSPPPSSSR